MQSIKMSLYVCFSPVGGLMPLSGKAQLKITSLYQQRALMWSSHQVMSRRNPPKSCT